MGLNDFGLYKINSIITHISVPRFTKNAVSTPSLSAGPTNLLQSKNKNYTYNARTRRVSTRTQ